MRLPSPLQDSWPLHYVIAIGAVILAIGARMLLDPFLGDRDPFVTFVIAVLIAIVYTGMAASLTALGFALLSVNYFFIAPRMSLAIADPADLLDFALYSFVGLIAIGLIHGQRRARYAAEASMADAHAKRSALEKEMCERRRVEEALRDSEMRLRAIIESEPQCVKVVSLDGILLEMNPAGLLMVEAGSARDVVGRSVLDLIHPEHRKAFQALHTSVSQGVPGTLEFRIVGLRGGVRWMETHSASLRNGAGEITSVLSVTHDITERKRAEEALRTSEQQFSSAFENAAIGMALVAPDGRWLKVNHSLCDLTGYSAEELLSKTFQDITHPDDLERDLEYVRQMLAGEIHTYHMEKRYFHKLGHPVWILLSVSLVRDAQGQPKHFTSQIQDITERRQLEDQLRQAQKMEAVGRLAGGIAHDFNNLLMVINGYSRIILDQHGTNERLGSNVQQIKEAGERAVALIQQLLAFSRKQVLVSTVVDLNVVVTGMSTMLQRLLGENIDLAADLDQAIGHVKADPGQLEQIIMNLALNARDAMLQGGKLTIETRNRDITEANRHGQIVRIGHYVTLTVSDTGCGMDPETQARIFEPFFTTKEQGKGTGFGLATVYGIVKQSDGYAFVYSEPGQGSTFRIYLPRVDEAVGTVACPPVERVPVTGTETILLVEDEPGVRTLIRDTLIRHGYTVREARHGFEALLLAHQELTPIHLLLTDVVMPQMSGRELAERLTPGRPHLKVLYMSGYTDAAVVHHGVLDPGTAFLQKPFEAAVLLRTVRDVLDTPQKP